MFSEQFLKKQRAALVRRRISKTNILESDGQQALSHSWKDIVRIDFAIKRLDEEQYGICTSCGTIIEEARLETIPETPFCTSCARSIEMQ
jgi:RNA polymerase-binding transcription factor DksA